MLNFGARKQGFHIAVSIDESDGSNTVTVTVTDSEGVEHTTNGEIIFDD